MPGRWLIVPLVLLLLATAWLDAWAGDDAFDGPDASPIAWQLDAAAMS